MKNTHTTNSFTGRAIGATFFAGFGALWLFLSLIARQLLSVISIFWVLGGLALLLAGAAYLFQEAKRFPAVPSDPAKGRAFTWINAIQWIVVSILAVTFAKFHIEAYIMSAITAVVGLHMFPLARLFRYPLHYASGAVLVLWAVASVVLVPLEQLQGITALGTGIILWLSAAVTLALAWQAVRISAEPLPQ